jgi:hypothetical protein
MTIRGLRITVIPFLADKRRRILPLLNGNESTKCINSNASQIPKLRFVGDPYRIDRMTTVLGFGILGSHGFSRPERERPQGF